LTSGYAGQQDLDRDGQSQASSESMANDELAYSEDVGLTAGGSREEKVMTDNNRARTFSMLTPCDLGKQPTGNIEKTNHQMKWGCQFYFGVFLEHFLWCFLKLFCIDLTVHSVYVFLKEADRQKEKRENNLISTK
jgi:hypothetical protein